MIAVRLLANFSGADGVLSRGEEHAFDAATAARLIESGFAEPITAPVEQAVKPRRATRRRGD